MKMFPVMAGEKFALRSVPWALVEPHEKQAWKNHGQTLERLAERGGLDPTELLAVLEDRRWRRTDEISYCAAEVANILSAWNRRAGDGK